MLIEWQPFVSPLQTLLQQQQHWAARGAAVPAAVAARAAPAAAAEPSAAVRGVSFCFLLISFPSTTGSNVGPVKSPAAAAVAAGVLMVSARPRPLPTRLRRHLRPARQQQPFFAATNKMLSPFFSASASPQQGAREGAEAGRGDIGLR